MIAGWAIYCLVTSALVAMIAAGVDEMLTRRRRPARWVWFGAIVMSLVVPGAILLWQQRAPAPISGAGDARFGDIFDRVRRREQLAAQHAGRRSLVERIPHVRTPQWLAADRVITAVIIACIAIATARVAVDSWLLYHRRRQWRAELLDDYPVLRSETLGPAIVGLITPAIVVPEWAAALPRHERSLMLAHEREHLAARDGLLTGFALLGALCMPWSPALWWSFRRLRTAVEIDCDRRVLRAFDDVAGYGRLLVDVAERVAGGSSLAITGLSERAGPLARRIRAMTSGEHRAGQRARRSLDAARGLACAVAFGVMFVMLPPLPAPRRVDSRPTDVLILPRGVADSISTEPEARGSDPLDVHREIVGVAHDLPAMFLTDDLGDASERLPAPARCPTTLRDPRTGTRLQVMVTLISTNGVDQHGDTAWARLLATGLYRVFLPGAYGVGPGQLLRVGCGSVTKRTIAGQLPVSTALSDLESRTDDRARRIGRAIETHEGKKPNEVELYAGRLNVVITDKEWMSRTLEDRRAASRLVWKAATDALGSAAMPETLALSIRIDSGRGMTQYYYKSHQR